MDIEQEISDIKKDIAEIKAVLAVISPYVEKCITADNSLVEHILGNQESPADE